MKTKLILILIFTLEISIAYGQQYNSCKDPIGQCKVIDKKGVKLFHGLFQDSTVITIIPYGEILTTCGHIDYPEMCRVFYKDTTGFVETKSIKIQEPINIFFLDEGYERFPVGKEYFGIFKSKRTYGWDNSFLKRCKMKVSYQLDNDSVKHPCYRLAEKEEPQILISGLKNISDTNFIGRVFDSKFLYPGESGYWGNDEIRYIIYAKGQVIENSDSANELPFSGIRNYEFHVKQTYGDIIEDKIIYKMDIRAWPAGDYEGGVYLHWIGDIDGDKKLDMIIAFSDYYSYQDIILFLSTRAEPGYFFKQVVKTPHSCC